MSLFDPRNLLAVIGTMLALIALYLILRNAMGAEGILKQLSTGSLHMVQALQGRG